MGGGMTDWPALIARLEAAGMRHIDIAIAVDRTERWVGMVKSGQIKGDALDVGVELYKLDAKVSRETQYHAK